MAQAWAAAIERRDWPTVRAYWGNNGATSGRSPAVFAMEWAQLKAPRVTLGAWQQEGAAGSSFATIPATVHDGLRTISGTVTWTRVNDVPGATSEQLRWHIQSSTLKP
ncbi:MAG: hypothetical protein JF593_03540 [Novosphingobium sp.]|nr:hypothetical protein [Novosphingobium sp.]